MKLTAKKLLALMLVLVMTLSLAACGGKTDVSSDPSSTPVDNTSATSSLDVTSEETTSDETSSNNTSSTTTSAQTSSNDKVSSEEDDEPAVEYEKSSAGDATVIYGKQTSKYDSQANAMRKAIINSKDSGLKGTKTFYVSYRGSDFNEGTSPDQAWQTISMVNAMKGSIPKGAVVLFERGGVYRGSLKLKSDCSYGAYGTGPKPCLYGSKKNYADESLWKKSKSKKNAWEIKVDEDEVGNIVFDHGKKVAVKVAPGAKELKDYTFVFNKGTLTLYISENPAKLYSDIEISGHDYIIDGHTVNNVVIENLCVKYCSSIGISLSAFDNNPCKNIVIRNCEVGYIGGGDAGDGIPIGNGIQFWAGIKGGVIENCWVYECLDAGLTNQGWQCTQREVTFKNNLIEYCVYPIEVFVQSAGAIENCLYTGNLLRFAGYGWSDPTTRRGEDWAGSDVASANFWGTNTNVGRYKATNVVFENNILDTSWKFLLNVTSPNQTDRVTVRNNTYYQKKSSTACIGTDGAIEVAGTIGNVRAENLAQVKEIIAKLDPTAKLVEFVG